MLIYNTFFKEPNNHSWNHFRLLEPALERKIKTGGWKKRWQVTEREMERRRIKTNRRYESILQLIWISIISWACGFQGRHSRGGDMEAAYWLYTAQTRKRCMPTVHWPDLVTWFQPHCKECWEKERSTWIFSEHCLLHNPCTVLPQKLECDFYERFVC